MDIAALLSGGVDSSVVVHLLCEQGYKPTLFYIKIGMDGTEYMDCSAEEDIELSTATARKYGLSLEVVDLHREYWDNVAAYAIDKIKKGLTPNPDVMCNKLIKFGCFEQRIGKDFDYTATGHYATTLQRNGKTWLGTAKDPVKDQTDFLAQIDYLQVSKLMFPIGGLMKHEVREIALNAGLPSARRKDSQGICFLGKINYNDFVRRFLGEKEGMIIELETGKKLGTHRCYWFHTIGQLQWGVTVHTRTAVELCISDDMRVILVEQFAVSGIGPDFSRFHPSSGDKATVLPAEPVPTKSYPHSHQKYRLHLHIRTHRTFSEKPENPNRFPPKQ